MSLLVFSGSTSLCMRLRPWRVQELTQQVLRCSQALDSMLTRHRGVAIVIAHRLTTIKNCDKIIVMVRKQCSTQLQLQLPLPLRRRRRRRRRRGRRRRRRRRLFVALSSCAPVSLCGGLRVRR